MKPLSPKANKVWKAFSDVHERIGVFEGFEDAVAASLRAAASELYLDPSQNSSGGTLLSCQEQLESIASELDDSTTQ